MIRLIQTSKFFVYVTVFSLTAAFSLAASGSQQVSFLKGENRLEIKIDGAPFTTYVFEDDNIPRPYFCHVFAPGGIPITRTHPPVKGIDPDDHATYHPGIWAAYGDIGGFDFWRNKARVEHVRFIKKPFSEKNTGRFTVLNHYLSSEGKLVCREVCHYTVTVRPGQILLIARSEFSSDADFYFGDQEEMGLGVRVATPISVKKGGRILNSNGLKDEKQVWGKQANWCDYAGMIEGRFAGITLMALPDNFRPSWFHARDYGLLVANPFGRNAFTNGEKSKVFVKAGKTFHLSFGVLVHSAPTEKETDIKAGYNLFLQTFLDSLGVKLFRN